ncbi:hypothetical protein CKAN_02112200 [Cinnamomum micranthum f. kanehirae]|uniref:Uncharacterized protein n=1 Tax=Cinnamomum micranthum f. kanehirae TaxID=337451 RepID=A0A3S3QX18_9MAGN|nr:hypothetical protein CKAN_02112200 [Cinnamomum micranthum f. kanehirae]
MPKSKRIAALDAFRGLTIVCRTKNIIKILEATEIISVRYFPLCQVSQCFPPPKNNSPSSTPLPMDIPKMKEDPVEFPIEIPISISPGEEEEEDPVVPPFLPEEFPMENLQITIAPGEEEEEVPDILLQMPPISLGFLDDQEDARITGPRAKSAQITEPRARMTWPYHRVRHMPQVPPSSSTDAPGAPSSSSDVSLGAPSSYSDVSLGGPSALDSPSSYAPGAPPALQMSPWVPLSLDAPSSYAPAPLMLHGQPHPRVWGQQSPAPPAVGQPHQPWMLPTAVGQPHRRVWGQQSPAPPAVGRPHPRVWGQQSQEVPSTHSNGICRYWERHETCPWLRDRGYCKLHVPGFHSITHFVEATVGRSSG